MANLSEIQSVIYADCPYTNFPSAVDTITRKTDVDLNTKALVDQYNSYVASGSFTAATELLANNANLRQTVMMAEDYNRMRDGLIAVQRIFNGYVADYIADVVKSKGTWSATATYNKYDVVTYSYNNAVQTYICLPQDETLRTIPAGTIPTNTTYWACITLEGVHGASGTGLSMRGSYDSSAVYYNDDLVTYNGLLYLATTETVEDPVSATVTKSVIYRQNGSDYVEIPVGTTIDPFGTYYLNDNGTYTEISNLSAYTRQASVPYEIYGQTPSSSSDFWKVIEVNHVSDMILPGVTIAASAWQSKQYTYTSDQIDANTLVEVFFNKDSFETAAAAGIYVESIANGARLTCMSTPSAAVTIDFFRIRKDITT